MDFVTDLDATYDSTLVINNRLAKMVIYKQNKVPINTLRLAKITILTS